MRSSDAIYVRMAPTAFSDDSWVTYGERENRRGRGGSAYRGMSRRFWVTAVVMWVAYVAMVTCNVLFEALRFGGTTAAEVSASVFAWFTSAGYVFAIWGLIYVGLFAWLAYYMREESRIAINADGSSMKIPGLFVASCALNVVWLILFHLQQTVWALVTIVALWFVLVALYRAVRRQDYPTRMMKALGQAPISLYTAWMTVAVIANASHVATRLAEAPMPLVGEVSTLILVALVLAAGYMMYKRYDDIVMPLVFLWAIIGVGVNLLGVSFSTALIIFALSAGAAFITFFKVDGVRLPSRAR